MLESAQETAKQQRRFSFILDPDDVPAPGETLDFNLWRVTMDHVLLKRFTSPDETRSFEKGTFEVVRGPYQFTRNPMYLSGMAIWLGWVIFYGSVAVLVGFVVVWMSVAFLVVPWEERKLEARIGEAYLRYKNTVPRWLGKRSR